MQKEYSPDFKNRGKLLELCMAMGMSNSMILETVKPMDGKTPKEKEQIAERIFQELQSKNGISTSKNNGAQPH